MSTTNNRLEIHPEPRRLEKTTILLLIVAIPLLLAPRFQEYALAVMDTAALLALLSVIHGLAFSRESLSRRSLTLMVCLIAMYAAHTTVAEPNRWNDLLAEMLRRL